MLTVVMTSFALLPELIIWVSSFFHMSKELTFLDPSQTYLPPTHQQLLPILLRLHHLRSHDRADLLLRHL